MICACDWPRVAEVACNRCHRATDIRNVTDFSFSTKVRRLGGGTCAVYVAGVVLGKQADGSSKHARIASVYANLHNKHNCTMMVGRSPAGEPPHGVQRLSLVGSTE